MTVWSCGANPVADRFFQVAKYNTYGNYSTLLYVNQGGDLHAAGNVYANGVQLTSDRNAKAGFTRISPGSVLPKVVALPIPEWNYKTDIAEQKHIGPMAQDFYAAFGLNGADNKHISVVDEGGVALAAIQGLNEKLEAALQSRDEEIEQLKASVSQLKQLLSQQTSNKHEQTETNSK